MVSRYKDNRSGSTYRRLMRTVFVTAGPVPVALTACTCTLTLLPGRSLRHFLVLIFTVAAPEVAVTVNHLFDLTFLTAARLPTLAFFEVEDPPAASTRFNRYGGRGRRR